MCILSGLSELSFILLLELDFRSESILVLINHRTFIDVGITLGLLVEIGDV